MRYCPRVLGCLIALAAAIALPLPAARPAEAPKRSPLAAVAALDKPVTVSETKIPLGELVQKIAADTGVRLIATRKVADEPVAVVVKDLPARELLQQLADLLDYRWSRRAKEGEWRYEIAQDLAATNREAALREAARADVRKRFQKELDRYVQVAGLSQEQIGQLREGASRRLEESRKLPLEQHLAFFNSPEGQEQYRRLVVTSALWSPVARTLATLMARLSPQQWDRLINEGQLVFATDPQPGELPLPTQAGDTFRASSPGTHPPGERVVTGSSEGDERHRRQEEVAKEQWAAATGYRVTFRLDGGLISTWGALRLQAEAAPVRGGERQPLFFHRNARLFLNAQTVEPQHVVAEQTVERRARLEKEPVLGERKPFKPAAKPRPDPGGAGRSGPRFTEFLPEIGRVYAVPLIADSYWGAPPLQPGDLPADGSTPLFALLDRLASTHHRWEHDGRVIRLWSRTWFFDRPREVPLRLVRRWQSQWARAGALALDDYVQMAAALTESQWKGMDSLIDAGELPRELQGVSRLRHALRLHTALSPGQRQALWQGRALPVARMTPGQRESFLALLQERSRTRPTPLPLADWPAGTLTLTSAPVTLRREAATEPGTAGDRTGPPDRAFPEARASSSSEPGTPAAERPAPASSPGSRIEFRFQIGPEIDERVILVVAALS